MPNTNVMALPSSVTSLDQYTRLVENFPRLDEEEERTLAARLKRDNDLTAAIKLITSHLRYVVNATKPRKLPDSWESTPTD